MNESVPINLQEYRDRCSPVKSARGIRSPLAALSFDQLAEHLRYYWRVNRPGINYMAKKVGPDKASCLASMLAVSSRKLWPDGFSVITFPGARWIYERALLNQREGTTRSVDHRFPRRTHIGCIERDEFVYRASLAKIPGGEHWIKHHEAPECATASIQTPKIQRYSRCEFEEFALESFPLVDAAWLDFNGGLTTRRAKAILRFVDQRRPAILGLTLSRRGDDTNRMVKLLAPDEMVFEKKYAEKVPMHHFVMAWNESRYRTSFEP